MNVKQVLLYQVSSYHKVSVFSGHTLSAGRCGTSEHGTRLVCGGKDVMWYVNMYSKMYSHANELPKFLGILIDFTLSWSSDIAYKM